MTRPSLPVLLITIIAVTACSASRSISPTAEPAPVTSSPTQAIAPAARVAGTPASPGGTHLDPYFRGRADAPVTLEEYADFQ